MIKIRSMNRQWTQALSLGLVAAAFVLGCSSNDKDGTTPASGSTDGKEDNGTGSPGTTAGSGAATGGTAPSDTSGQKAGAEITDAPCTEEGSVCTTYAVPAEMTGSPERVFVAFYKKLPPMGPPDVFGNELKKPSSLAGGKPFTIKQTGMSMLAGQSLYVYTVIYMPGGGQFQPKPGVDYVAQTETPITFDGKAVSLPNLTFQLAK